MKILLLTCLVASVFAAPAEKTKRNILPGDSRYNTHDHHHDDIHDHHSNEVEIAQALGGSTGPFSLPITDYGVPGLKPGTPLGIDDFKSTEKEFNSRINTEPESLTESSKKSDEIDVFSRKDISEDTKVAVSSAENIGKDTAVSNDAISSEFSSTTPKSVINGGSTTFDSVSIDAAPIESSTSSFQPDFGSSFGSTFGHEFGHSLDTPFYSPTVETIPLGATGFSTFDQKSLYPSFLPSYNFDINADKKSVNDAGNAKVEVKSGSSEDTSKTTFESSTVKADFGSTIAPNFDSSFSPPFGQPLAPSFYSSSFGAVPFNTAGFNTFDQVPSQYDPNTFSNFGLFADAGKATPKSIDDFNIKVTTESSKPNSDGIKTFVESTTAKAETSGKEFSSGAGSATGSLTSPIKTEGRLSFGSDYSSGFPSSFGQSFGSDLSSSSFGSVPFDTSAFNNYDQVKYGYNPFSTYDFNTNAGTAAVKSKESNKLAEAKTTVSEKRSDAVNIEKSTKPVSGGSFGPTLHSGASSPVTQNSRLTQVEVIPSISTNFKSFGQEQYSPSLSARYPYTSNLNGFNQNYGQYGANYGSLGGYRGTNTFDRNTFSGLNSYIPPQPLQYQTGYPSSQFLGSSSSFPSTIPAAESNPFGFDISSQGSYLSPSIGQQFSVSTAAPPFQEAVFKNYQSPTSFVQASPAPFFNQHEVKIGGSSFSGISQQTDANGGYIY